MSFTFASALLSIACAATPIFAQSTLPSGTSVRMTLTDQRVLEGRLIRGDSNALTIAIRDAIIDVGRGQISSISRRSLRTGTYARRAGWVASISGVALGVVVHVIGAGSDRPIKWTGGAYTAAAFAGVVGGVIGASIGAITGAAVGSLVHGRTPVTPTVLVTTSFLGGQRQRVLTLGCVDVQPCRTADHASDPP